MTNHTARARAIDVDAPSPRPRRTTTNPPAMMMMTRLLRSSRSAHRHWVCPTSSLHTPPRPRLLQSRSSSSLTTTTTTKRHLARSLKGKPPHTTPSLSSIPSLHHNLPLASSSKRTLSSSSTTVETGKLEIETATVPLLTLDHHPLGRITKVHGIVSASSVRNRNILIDGYVAIRGILGGNAPSYESLLNDAMISAANGLAEAAHELGATHVINVRFEKSVIITRFVIGTHVFLTAYGTAVDIELFEEADVNKIPVEVKKQSMPW